MSVEDDFEPLSRAERRELERRVKDSRDPIRYMIVTEFTRRFILYYNLSDDVWAFNNPEGGTVFKRKKAATAIAKLLGDRHGIIRVSAVGDRIRRRSPYRDVLVRPARRTVKKTVQPPGR